MRGFSTKALFSAVMLGDTKLAQELVPLLKADDWVTRQRAANALGHAKEVLAIDQLVEVALNDFPTVMYEVRLCLPYITSAMQMPS